MPYFLSASKKEFKLKNQRLLLFFLMILLGAGVGIAIGWFVFPPQAPENAKIYQLRADFKADFALMASEQYAIKHDPKAALDELAKLDSADPINYLVSAIKFAEGAGYPAQDLGKMRQLFNGIDAKTLQEWKAGGSGGN
ncbi:MAG: hypothetical protein VB108_02465 [Anaerolineaceae bacterium]|nr:hypothetical protein [Anaerolineaceae bacterium]